MEKVIKQVNKYMQLYKNPPPVNLYSPDTKSRFFQQFIFVLGAWSNFSFQVEEIVGRKCSITLYQEKIILEEVNFLYCKIYPFPFSLSLLLNFPSFLFFFFLLYSPGFVDPERGNYVRTPGANSVVAERMTIHAYRPNEDK